jgi:hypothetical protein
MLLGAVKLLEPVYISCAPLIALLDESEMVNLPVAFPTPKYKNEEISKIALVFRCGVIVTAIPVTSTRLALVVVRSVVSVALTTCKIADVSSMCSASASDTAG